MDLQFIYDIIYVSVRAAKQHAKAWCFLLEMEAILFSLVSY